MTETRRPLGHGEFVKYQALGNDYLVVDARVWPAAQTPEAVRALCHRHLGVGSDGVLALLDPSPGCAADLTILNPDGSVAEKSGNGLRIFARALWDMGYTHARAFKIGLTVGQAPIRLLAKAPHSAQSTQPSGAADSNAVAAIEVGMGRPKFTAQAVGFRGGPEDTVRTTLEVMGQTLDVTLCSVGNPHCVVFVKGALDVDVARTLGPAIEHHPGFANRTNVQFVTVSAKERMEILIWERGAGLTAASGSSSSAAVASAHARQLVGDEVTVVSPGGALHVRIDAEGGLWLTGPAAPVCRGHWLGPAGGA